MAQLFHTSATTPLLKTRLFKPYAQELPLEDQLRITYQRARAIARSYGTPLVVSSCPRIFDPFELVGLTEEDAYAMSDKFWELTSDGISAVDGGAMTLLGIHYNLGVGTLARFSKIRPDLQPLLKQAVNFDVK